MINDSLTLTKLTWWRCHRVLIRWKGNRCEHNHGCVLSRLLIAFHIYKDKGNNSFTTVYEQL